MNDAEREPFVPWKLFNPFSARHANPDWTPLRFMQYKAHLLIQEFETGSGRRRTISQDRVAETQDWNGSLTTELRETCGLGLYRSPDTQGFRVSL